MSNKVFFSHLNGFRFIAFFSVFLFHAFPTAYISSYSSSLPYQFLINLFFQQGENGVSLFFVISGFLITYLLLDEKNKTNKIEIIHFYMRRVLRIWPLYFLILIISFFIIPFFDYSLDIKESKFLSFLFLSNFNQIDLLKNNITNYLNIGITWSVSVEEQFYLVWPLVIYIFNRKKIIFFFALLIVLSLGFKYANKLDKWVLYLHTFSVIYDLVIGAVGAYLMFYSDKAKQMIEKIPTSIICLFYVVLICIIGLDKMLIPHFYARLLLPLLFLFLILEQNYSLFSFYKIGNFKRLSKLGEYTYGMYLLHPIAIFITSLFMTASNLGTGLVSFSISLCITIILSILSFNYFEKHFLALKNRF